MIKRLYKHWLRPEIPEEAKEYKYQLVHKNSLWAFNRAREGLSTISSNMEMGYGCLYSLSQDGCAWEFSNSYDGWSGVVFTYQSLVSSNIADVWVNTDITTSSGTIMFRTSDRGTVEYGFWDGGEDGDLSILQFTVPQGFHVAGNWQCIVSGTDSAVASFEWYRNNALISTVTGRTHSECRPTADQIGTFNYKCVITFENGKSVTAEPMTMTVEAYDPGGDPDPGGGGGGGGDDDGDDETSLVTGIDLHVYPETVVPGGHATIEVTVNGIGNYSQAFTARLSGNSSPETELFSAGNSCNVWIAEEETAEYVLVTVASVQDPTITATEMIYIDYSGTEDEGTTQEQLQRAFWKGYAAARAYFQEAKVSASASIHIAREEAEPTTKAGKLRRSFWQGFVSALIVAAAETEPETVPDGVLISSDGYILTDCNGVYLIAKEE